MNEDQSDSQTEVDEDAAFAAGLQDLPTETPVAAKEPEEPAAQVEPVEQAPKYAQITEEQWQEIQSRAARADELKATLEKVSGTAFGKIGGIERTLQQLQSSGVGQVSAEDFTKLSAEFPDLAEMLVEGLNAALKKAPRAQQVDLAEVEGKFNAALAERLDKQELALETRLLTSRHKDWREVVATPEFQAWQLTKPITFQQQLAGRDSDFIADALTEFKTARKAADANTRRGRIEAAVTPRGTGGNATHDTEDPFMAGLRTG